MILGIRNDLIHTALYIHWLSVEIFIMLKSQEIIKAFLSEKRSF